jgi:hypothetical protein
VLRRDVSAFSTDERLHRKAQGAHLGRLTVRTIAPRIDTGLLAELDKWRLASAIHAL